MRGPAWKTGAVAGLCFLAAVAGGWSAAGQQVDAWAYDLLLRLRPPRAGPASALVVALDEETLRAYGSMAHLRQPLTRVLERIAGAGAKAVAADIQLADLYNAEWDARLSRALEATPGLVLATTLVENSQRGSISWEDPRPEFGRRAALGHVHAAPDLDGISRQVRLEETGAGQRRWALALEAFRLASGGGQILESEDALLVGERSIPAARRDRRALRVRYLPPGDIERISVKALIEQPDLAARLRGRAVFIGVTVQGGPDRLMTPYSDGVAMPGVEIHASLYETLARGQFLLPVSNLATVTVAAALAAAMAAGFLWLSGAPALLWGFGWLALAHALPYALFTRDLVLPFSTPAAAAWLSFLAFGAWLYVATRGKLEKAEAQRARYQQAVHYVTHEMRTPLTAIQGSSEMMGRYAMSEEKRREMAGMIHRESRRLARMVDMFLSVERLSAGQLDLKREPVAVAELLAACADRVRPLADRKQIRVTLRPGAGERILGDAEFLDYACFNLITNAIKYSPAGTEILVSAEGSGGAVRLAVRDQGYGMNENELKRVFQKFYRAPRAVESGEGGTGIGLALVEEIVVQHGGSIEVESRPNQGSQFTLVLPRAAAGVAAG